jgi:hypothetical protein
MRLQGWLPVVVIAIAGCGTHAASLPPSDGAATMHGRVEADYAIPPPPAAPCGEARLASYGVAEIATSDRPEQRLRALHLRIVLANTGATPWTFDTREQRLDLVGHDPLHPALASANAGPPPPVITLRTGEKRVADLFFALPGALQSAAEIPEFDAVWRLNVGAQVVAQRTPFDRLIVEPDLDYAGWDDDYGPDYYWGGPFWVNEAYGSSSPFVAGAEVHVRRGLHFVHGRGFHAGAHAALARPDTEIH